MKILLVSPPFYRLKAFKSIFLPLGIASLSAYIQKKGREVKLYNADNPAAGEIKGSHVDRILSGDDLFQKNLESDAFVVWKEFKDVLAEFNPDVVGISVMTCKYATAQKLSKITKNFSKNSIVVWGGPHCSADGINTLKENPFVDYVVTNEGEIAFNRFLEKLEQNKNPANVNNLIFRTHNNEIVANPPGKPIEDLDSLPFPNRDTDVFQERYPNWTLNTIMASRGCPYKCAYCDSRSIWGRKVRRRSVENVLNEMKEMKTKWKITDFHFVDDTFTLDPHYTVSFCKALRKSRLHVGWTCNTRMNVLSDQVCRALKKSGVIFVSCGIETGSQPMLDYINKGITLEKVLAGANLLKKHGIDWHAFLMVGFPRETLEDVELTRRFWKELKPGCASLSIFTPSPNTELFEEAKKLGLIEDKPDWSRFSWQDMNSYFAPNIPREQFNAKVKEMFEEIHAYNNSFFNVLKKIYRRKRYYLFHLDKPLKKALNKSHRKGVRLKTTR